MARPTLRLLVPRPLAELVVRAEEILIWTSANAVLCEEKFAGPNRVLYMAGGLVGCLEGGEFVHYPKTVVTLRVCCFLRFCQSVVR